jgi:adenylate cyclase
MTTQEVKRKLTAILSADVKGYSRLMGEDEEWTLRKLNAYKEVMRSFIQQYRGRIVGTAGDSILAEFASVVDAVQCAVEIQKELKTRNAELPENRRMEFRIGVNLGDVIEEENNIYGDGVNIAARMESLADGGGICISGTVYDHIENKLSLAYNYLGEQTVKNIAKPVRVYKVLTEPGAIVMVAGEKKAKPRQWQRPPLIIVVALIVVAAAFAVWRFYIHPAPPIEVASKEKMAFPLPDKPSIAVLPFVNMSDDPKQEFFSDGITEEIITALSKVPRLFVIARNSTFTYKGKSVKVKQVSEELGVRYVLEGSVRRAGNKVRITAQLIDALAGHHLWAERYDRDLKDIFALQDEVTLKIINALQVKLTDSEQIIVFGKSTNNLEAYLKLLKAREYSNPMTKEGNLLHRKLAEEAIALDPRCAVAYLILSAAHLRDLFFGWSESPEQSLRLAEDLVKKAFALDDSLGMAHAYLGRIYLTKKQHDQAIAEGERALALSPNDDFIQAAFAVSLYYSGRIEESIALYKKALRLNPFPSVWYLWGLGSCYRDIGRYEEAIGEFRKALHLYPDSLLPHLGLATTYSLMGRDQEAHAETTEVLRIDTKFSLNRHAKGFLFFKNQTDADRYMESLRKAGLK